MLYLYSAGPTQLGWQRLPRSGTDWLLLGREGKLIDCRTRGRTEE